MRAVFGIASPFDRCRWGCLVRRRNVVLRLPLSRKARATTLRLTAHFACVFILLEPALRAFATITCLQAMFVKCAAFATLEIKESASRICEGGSTARFGVRSLRAIVCYKQSACIGIRQCAKRIASNFPLSLPFDT